MTDDEEPILLDRPKRKIGETTETRASKRSVYGALATLITAIAIAIPVGCDALRELGKEIAASRLKAAAAVAAAGATDKELEHAYAVLKARVEILAEALTADATEIARLKEECPKRRRRRIQDAPRPPIEDITAPLPATPAAAAPTQPTAGGKS